MITLKEAFFKDLSRLLVMWRDDLVSAITNPATAGWAETEAAIRRLHTQCSGMNPEDLRVVLNECFRGILHSTLVTIEGGSESNEVGTLQLIDAATGQPLTTGALHEEFFEYLGDRNVL
jgi:hypothetical protein